MAKPGEGTVGRRKFLTAAAATAATAAAGVGPGQVAGQPAADDHEHQAVPSDIALRVKALETVLVEKEMVDPAELDAVVDVYENEVGPRNGAQVVARAWVDPPTRRACCPTRRTQSQSSGSALPRAYMVVVENEPRVHNLLVCTLCSCYPWPTLGLPPVWYKSAPYRSRAVIDPRGCFASSISSLPTTSRYACGTAPPICATSCYPNGRPEPRT